MKIWIFFFCLLSFQVNALACKVFKDFKIQNAHKSEDYNPKTKKVEKMRSFIGNLSFKPKSVFLHIKAKDCSVKKTKLEFIAFEAKVYESEEEDHESHGMPAKGTWRKLESGSGQEVKTQGDYLVIGPIELDPIFAQEKEGHRFWKLKVLAFKREYVLLIPQIH